MDFPQMLPYVVIVVVGGLLWWRQSMCCRKTNECCQKINECCQKIADISDWVNNGGVTGGGVSYSSVDDWIAAVHEAICALENSVRNNAPLPDNTSLCGGGSGGNPDPTDPPRSPPPF